MSEFSFQFDGGAHPTDARMCTTCASAADKVCTPPVGTAPHGAPDPECAYCASAASGVCPTHCGVMAALDAIGLHKPSTDDVQPLAADFTVARALIDAKIAAMPKGARVKINASASVGHDEYPDALRVEVIRLA